jgi:hypothetical protein
MLPQSRTLEGGTHVGERESAEGFRRHRKVRAGCRHSRGEPGREARAPSPGRGKEKVTVWMPPAWDMLMSLTSGLSLCSASPRRGRYQRTRLTKQGFPRGYLTRSKRAFGFQTGDLVKVVVTTGQKFGSYVGRVAIRASGRFNIQTTLRLVQGISHRFCALIQRADGYGYAWTQIALQTKGGAGRGQPASAALSLPA